MYKFYAYSVRNEQGQTAPQLFRNRNEAVAYCGTNNLNPHTCIVQLFEFKKPAWIVNDDQED